MVKEINDKLYHVSTLPAKFMNSWHKKLLGMQPYCSNCKLLWEDCKNCPNKDDRLEE